MIVRARAGEAFALGPAPASVFTFGYSVATVPLQNVAGHRSQFAEQQSDGTIPEAHAVTARKPMRAASPASLRERMLGL